MRGSKFAVENMCRGAALRRVLAVLAIIACSLPYVQISRQSRVAAPVAISLPQASPGYEFVTFAFTERAGGRWTADACYRAIRLTYSSLVKSQLELPRLHVFTDVARTVPNQTTMGTRADIEVHICTPEQLPQNDYTDKDPWKSLSRAKLDVAEQLILSRGKKIVWIDLDTLVFADLGITSKKSWLVGYQNGGCDGAKNCSWEHIANGGESKLEIKPKFDALGDLWSLDLKAIAAVRLYESEHVKSGLPLPKYDLQGYFSFMLQDQELPAVLLHDVIDCNFGFFCSDFKHPSSENMELAVVQRRLICPKRANVEMSEWVGAISFTAPTFQELLLRTDNVDFSWIGDREARSWLENWFFSS